MKRIKQSSKSVALSGNNKHRLIPSLMIAIGVFFGFYNFISPSPVNLIIEMVCSIICMSFSGIIWNEQNQTQIWTLLILVFMAWLFNVMSVFAQGGYNPMRLATLAYMLYTVLVSFVMIKTEVGLLPLKIVFYFIGLYFIYKLVFLEVSPTEIFSMSAGGLMNSILLSIAVPIQLLEYRRNGKVSIIPPIIIFVVSLYSVSRTSMLCAAVYLLIIIGILSFKTINKKIIGVFIFSLVLLFIIRFAVNHWNDIMAFEIYEKFEEKGTDSSGRYDIWRYYFNNMSFFYFLFGRNVDEFHMILGLANTHNSFIQLHSQLGILGVVYIIYFIRVACYYIRNNFFTFLMLLVLILRCFYDTPYFFNVFDFAMVVFILEYKKQTQSISKERRLSLSLL